MCIRRSFICLFTVFTVKIDLRTLLAGWLLVLLLSKETVSGVYLNQVAVHIQGGNQEAHKIAKRHGFINLGQIGSLEDHYLFEHPHIQRRSASPSHEHHQRLSNEPQVRWFEQQKVQKRVKRDLSPELRPGNRDHDRHDKNPNEFNFNDQLWVDQWYLHGGGHGKFDMNVVPAWQKGYTGRGVVITILDDGLERTHDDLRDNYDPYASYDVNGKDSDPTPRYDPSNENRHGTRCAGEVSAKANNSKCNVGVAYNSRIGGVRMLDGEVFDAVEATSLSFNRTHIDIYSASWGPDDDGRVVDGPGRLAKIAFTEGIEKGRGGKGSIFVWASGNGGSMHDSCNCDGYTNSIYTLSISSTSQNGQKPWYLEECSSTLASTYSSGAFQEKQIVTVDLHNLCTKTHTGTSASAPLAAGLLALVLEANPSLTWRDVQYITLMAANPAPMQDGQWTTNGLGRKVSLRYGYGLMDAGAMVDLAEKWTNVPESHICQINSTQHNLALSEVKMVDEVVSSGCSGQPNSVQFLEHVQVMVTLKYQQRGRLTIHLTSPMGTKSTVLPIRENDMSSEGFRDWKFLSVHFWGEDPTGTWKLGVEDKGSRSWGAGVGVLVSWSLILHGTATQPVKLNTGEITPTPHHTPHPVPTSGHPAPTPSEPIRSPTVTPPTAMPCDVECLGPCTGLGPADCDNCKHYRIGTQGACVSECPPGHSVHGWRCLLCDVGCDSCDKAAPNMRPFCHTCSPGYLLVEGQGECVIECGLGYFLDAVSKQCRRCSKACLACEGSADRCTQCSDGTALIGEKCVHVDKNCPSDWYVDEQQHCKPCPMGCASCTGPSHCTNCADNWYHHSAVCVTKCPINYLSFQIHVSEGNNFGQCRLCDKAAGHCDSCPPGFQMEDRVCKQTTSCPDHQFLDFDSMLCRPCNQNCHACHGPTVSNCLSCTQPLAYQHVLHMCMPCCTDQSQVGCCPCDPADKGKCLVKELPSSIDVAVGKVKSVIGVATVILILLVVSIVIVGVVVIIITVLNSRRKGKGKYSMTNGYTYERLLTGEDEDNI